MSLNYEDTIQSLIFSTKSYISTEWQQLCDQINETISCLSHNYIWHRDEFKVLVPIAEEKNGIPPHLMGTACFGDNIEDEWFIVYLLLELTKKHTELIIKIEDNDGNFLLIEAADYLPSWANPDTTENRVFMYGSNIHIIPPHLAPIDSQLELKDLLKLIAEKSEETKALPDIQRAILKRISKYPKQIEENCHKSIVKLPLEIAAVLTIKPTLISSLVTTYCNLDAIEAKNCNNIELDDFIKVEVKFTKFLYAMLMHTRFPNGCRFKNLLNDKHTQLGLKLSCGYRTIMTKSRGDIFSTSEYVTFFNSLTKNGYFKENLKGSVEYQRLLEAAKFYFTHMECPVSTHAYNIISNIKLSNEFDETKETLKHKSDEDSLKEDDDTWLNIHPDQLNEFLNEHYGRKVQIKNNDPITPHIITSELANFLRETSDFEGVEENIENNIDFNSDEFVNCLEKMLNIISNNENLNNSDESDFSDDETVISNSEQDDELAAKLKTTCQHNGSDKQSMLQNLIQGMKEEGSSGPVSTVFRSIGLKKSDLIDSDDDE